MTRKKHAPKHGSLAYLPRGRAKNILARTHYWPEIESDTPTLLGYVGFKAGMTHVFAIDNRKGTPNYGKETIRPATVLETPPVLVCAIKVYTRNQTGFRTFTEAWMKGPPEELERVFTIPENFKTEEKLKKIEKNLDKAAKIRVLVATHPKQASVPRKKPDVTEIEIGGGTVQQRYEYAKNLLGKAVTPPVIFKEGQLVDTIAVTIGKGWQGPVKRWGINILPRKSRKTKRGIATLGPWKPPRVRYSIPRAGQMGFHQRTEYNKQILKMGTDGKEVTPKGGFIRYGAIRGSYMIIDGSVPGSEKRSIMLRYPARPTRRIPEEPPQITYISLESPQGK